MHWLVWLLALGTPLASSFFVYYLNPPARQSSSPHPLAPSDKTSKWFFPLAWTLLYSGFGLSLALTLRAWLDRGRTTFSSNAFLAAAIALFIVNLCLNYAYLVVNFGKGDVVTGEKLILYNLAAAVFLAVVLAAVSPVASVLILPYAGYLFYAWRLQAHIVQEERGRVDDNRASGPCQKNVC